MLFTLVLSLALAVADDKPVTPEEAARMVDKKVTVEMTVESDKALTPLRWHKDSDSVFALLREIAYASMRRDTAFFE